MKLIKKVIYSGTITLKTGLHIGGTNSAMNIGGPDKFVVRNPISFLPYIPGSSLKGKMRSLIELKYGETNGGKVSNNPDGVACSLFGCAAEVKNGHPSRLIVRDAVLDPLSADFSRTDLPYTESKTETFIDRITANSNPRVFERVPAGAKFNLEMVLNIFDTDDESALKRTLAEGMSILEEDYLGGQGSRGYGQIKIDVRQEEHVY